jgi:hypothetical protein
MTKSAVPLVEKIERIHRSMTRARVPHAFGGAVALAYYATPRTTIDVDVNVFVPTREYGSIVRLLSRLDVDRFPDEATAVRDGQVRAWWGRNPIDLFFSYDPVHDAMRDATRTVPFGKGTIPILAPEHLLVAKAVFNRSKDWIDIEQMLIAVGDLDLREVDRWLDHLVGTDDPRAERYRQLRAKTRDV